jgi:HK97 family phage prohead protease
MDEQLLFGAPVVWDLAAAKANGDSGMLEGYASVFDVVDEQDDVVARGAFKPALARWRATKSVVPLSVETHGPDSRAIIGSMVRGLEDAHGLKFAAKVSADPDAQSARKKAIEGHLRGMSFLATIAKRSTGMRGGREVRVIEEFGRLLQITLTGYPVNMQAMLTVAKSGMPVHHTAVTDAGRWDAGANVARISKDTAATLRGMYAMARPGVDPDTKGAYALPHHVVGEDGRPGPAHIAAVRNALARLPTAQGFDDTARTAAEKHLRAHLDDFNARAAAGLDLPGGWSDDMRSALAISDPVASKAAVDRLVTSAYGPALAGGYRHLDPATAPEPSHVEDPQSSARYALELIGETGEGAGGDSTSDSLADLMASVEAANTSTALDQLMVELDEG